MTEWFARPVLHVADVEASLLFYVNRLGFTSPWRYEEDGRAYVAQVERQGCALILANTWPEKIGNALMFISLNVSLNVSLKDELRSQYVVSYKPADFDADGRYRTIEISALKKDLQVRSRKGYFAPQQ